VYGREIDGNVLTLSASGWLYDDLFVLYDYETETIWYPVNLGQAGFGCGCVLWGIAGQYAGRMVQPMPFLNTTWNIWFGGHPDSKLMEEYQPGDGIASDTSLPGDSR